MQGARLGAASGARRRPRRAGMMTWSARPAAPRVSATPEHVGGGSKQQLAPQGERRVAGRDRLLGSARPDGDSLTIWDRAFCRRLPARSWPPACCGLIYSGMERSNRTITSGCAIGAAGDSAGWRWRRASRGGIRASSNSTDVGALARWRRGCQDRNPAGADDGAGRAALH